MEQGKANPPPQIHTPCRAEHSIDHFKAELSLRDWTSSPALPPPCMLQTVPGAQSLAQRRMKPLWVLNANGIFCYRACKLKDGGGGGERNQRFSFAWPHPSNACICTTGLKAAILTQARFLCRGCGGRPVPPPKEDPTIQISSTHLSENLKSRFGVALRTCLECKVPLRIIGKECF